MSWHSDLPKSAALPAFAHAFRATPSGVDGFTTVSFIPPLPATATAHALCMTSCATGTLNDLLDTLAAERGVTLTAARFPTFPAALYARTNTEVQAGEFAFRWELHTGETRTAPTPYLPAHYADMDSISGGFQ